MNDILEVENLCKTYEKSDFRLKDVSFCVPGGSIMGFVGENGAGKTTTINCILNALFKDSGTVRIFGKEMADEDTSIREDLGVVFDNSSFSGQLDAGKLSRVMAGIYSRWDHEEFVRNLEKFQIPDNKKIRTFSRGMSMKLSIAVALSHQPKLLILDEATTGLDPVVRDEILDVFLDFVQDEDHSILLSSHITSDLEKIADYITFIHQGAILLTASKDELIYEYAVMRCKQSQFDAVEKLDILAYRKRDYQVDVLVKNRKEMERKYRDVVMDQVSIDDIMLLLIKEER